MKPWKRIFLVTLVLLTILSLVLSACGPTDTSNGSPDNTKDKDKNKDKDKGNGDDQEEDQGANADKITICHRTGSTKHPYVTIRIAGDAAREGHGSHTADLIPAPKDGCPTTVSEK